MIISGWERYTIIDKKMFVLYIYLVPHEYIRTAASTYQIKLKVHNSGNTLFPTGIGIPRSSIRPCPQSLPFIFLYPDPHISLLTIQSCRIQMIQPHVQLSQFAADWVYGWLNPCTYETHCTFRVNHWWWWRIWLVTTCSVRSAAVTVWLVA